MGELAIGVFDGVTSASRILHELRAPGTAPAGVASAGTVSVGEDGSYAVGTTDRPGSPSGFSGVFWEALFGLVFVVHVPGSSYGPGAGALFAAISRAGVDEDFQARARAALTPGTSAIGLVLDDEDGPEALALLTSHGPRIVRKWLSPEQDAELGRELGRAP